MYAVLKFFNLFYNYGTTVKALYNIINVKLRKNNEFTLTIFFELKIELNTVMNIKSLFSSLLRISTKSKR
jgi:hypothetical protein